MGWSSRWPGCASYSAVVCNWWAISALRLSRSPAQARAQRSPLGSLLNPLLRWVPAYGFRSGQSQVLAPHGGVEPGSGGPPPPRFCLRDSVGATEDRLSSPGWGGPPSLRFLLWVTARATAGPAFFAEGEESRERDLNPQPPLYESGALPLSYPGAM